MNTKSLKMALGTIGISLMLFGLYKAIIFIMSKPEISVIYSSVSNFQVYSSKEFSITIGSITLSLILIAVGFKISKIISDNLVVRILKRLKISEGAVATVKTLSFYFFLTLFIIVAFSVSKIPLTVFTLFGGALAIGIGFGSQSIISNFISGLIIQIERPMKVGDIISLENFKSGKITEIGARSTKILTMENTHVVVPNSYFLDRQFINLTLTSQTIRASVSLSFAPEQDIQVIKKMIFDAIKKLDGILDNPYPEVYFSDITENSIKFTIHFWLYLNREKSKAMQESALREMVYEDAKGKGIKFSKPIVVAKFND